MIKLLVKGDRSVALRAAQGWGVQAEFDREWDNYTYLQCPAEHLTAVARWFSYDKGPAPFPDGSLLHYTFREAPL
jgi:hypothetical protein